MLEDLLKGVGLLVVAGGGLVGIAYAIFRRLGEKWLDAKFDERLAAYKHEQQKEIEQLRFRINALFDRATKLHQREFEVLPEAWARLNDAYWKAVAFVDPAQAYPDLNQMSSAHLEEFLGGCPLAPWQKDELKSQQDRTSYYIKQIFWHRLGELKAAARESHVFLLKNGIFLSANIREGFMALDSLVWEALDESERNERYGQLPRESGKASALRENGPTLLSNLEAVVRGRLWDSQQSAL